MKYIYRSDIVDRKTLEQNFKTKFEALNRVRLSDNEFLRLREEIMKPIHIQVAHDRLKEYYRQQWL